jgi:serpin B
LFGEETTSTKRNEERPRAGAATRHFVSSHFVRCPLAQSQLSDRASDYDLELFIRGNNEFALELYGCLRRHKGNLFIAPFSISSSLALAYAGARGDTAAQIAKVLHFSVEQESVHRAFARLLNHSSEEKATSARLHIANAVWGQKGHGYATTYVRLIEKYYGSKLIETDFASDLVQSLELINRWAQDRTHGRIKNFLNKQDLDTDCRMVLTNAVYFKAPWTAQFSKSATSYDTFWLTTDKKVKVPMMQQHGLFDYCDTGELEMLGMGYGTSSLGMFVILPKKGKTLDSIERAFTGKSLSEWIDKLRPHKVDVVMPKYTVTGEFRLGKELASMGMGLAFSNSADFTGITSQAGFRLRDVVHKTWLSVCEDGTEAAAATATVADVAISAPPRASFRADRPFLFLIRDGSNTHILFVGRITDPRG